MAEFKENTNIDSNGRKCVIELKDVRRDFKVGDETVHALRGITFKIYEGEFVTIMGTSGSGKSTLLNQLGCLDTPTSGEFYLDGVSVRGMKRRERVVLRNRKIGFVFQNYNLLPKTTAVENVELPLMYNRNYNARQRREAAIKALQEVGLGNRLEHKSNQMSGGQMQRVAIARALVNNLYSGTIVGSDGKWNVGENGVKALELLKTMYDNKSMDAGFSMAAADELQQFQQETCAMTFCWGTSNAKSYASEDYTQISVPFPSDDGVPELEYLVNGFCVFDNGDDAKAEASKRFISFICDDAEWGPKSVVQTGAFPVRASFGNLYEGNDEMSLLASWSQYYGPYYNTRAGFAAMRPLWFNMLQQVFNGTPAQEAADAFNSGANG